ncbi:unnamed protein product [Cylicostephanus goldi]|uniref:Uncharacterized protein n=1 Tax=Cylicostephanus goldi TaxID=71465 RepID=A0A3P7N2T9_CYLGO|nr:unnamed protein product [Cylicostephanus goldi]
MVNCYECESFGAECFTGQCTAQYCLYQRQRRRSTGTTYIKKSCTNIPFVEYPDNRPSSALNTCEYRTIDDIQYEVKICNTGNNCNIACPAQDGKWMLENCHTERIEIEGGRDVAKERLE